MALTVEDGTIVTGADSYISQSDADAYFVKYNNATWSAAAAEDKDAGLRAGTRHIDSVYQFIGEIVDTSQPLLWPRNAGYDAQFRTIAIDEIPQRVKDAVCELAVDYLTNGAPLPSYERETQSEKVGDLAVTYFRGKNSRSFPLVSTLLRDLIIAGNKLVRA